MKKYGGNDNFPAIPKLIEAGWNSPTNLRFNWVIAKQTGLLSEFLQGDRRCQQMPGLRRLLSARCVYTTLVSLEHLHECEELTISTLDIQSFGLSENKQSGYLTKFCLDHEGSEAMTSGFPYYRRDRQQVGVADAFQAVLVSFIYFLAPQVWNEMFVEQEALPEEARLLPMEFVKVAIKQSGWP